MAAEGVHTVHTMSALTDWLRNIFSVNISAVITCLCTIFLSNEPAMPIIHDLIILLSQFSLFGELAEHIWTPLSLNHIALLRPRVENE